MAKFFLGLLAIRANALELTSDTWDAATAGKSVFIKFQAPWWGHCKSMKPAWDQLMDEFSGSPTSLIADVDCTADGKDLCETHGVQGFPTIKFGDPTDLQDYQGGRDFDSLKKHAEESLGPQCGPANLDLCDEKRRKKLEGFMAMSLERVEAKITNTQRIMEEEVPLMKKVVGYLKTKKEEL